MTPHAEATRASKARGALEVSGAYVLAVGAQLAVLIGWTEAHPLLVILASHIAATLVIFAFSVGRDNSSFFDAYWSVIPITTAGWLAVEGLGSATVPTARAALVVALVSAWGLRLTYNWWRGWAGLHHEDWRYVDFRNRFGKLYWLVSLSGIHLFPALLVFAGCTALWPALATGGAPLGWLDALATIVTASAITIETVADRQLWDWRQTRSDPAQILHEGLWRWSRHPNYFGECSFWWGLALFALAAEPGGWVYLSGAVLMTCLFVFISIPLIEKRALKKRPHYAAVVASTSRFVPWPPRGA